MTNKGDTVFDVSLRFTIKFGGIVAAIIAVLTVVFYLATGEFTDTVIFLAAAAAAGGTITTAFYVARTLNLYIRQEYSFREREAALDERGRKERALRYGERWNDPKMFYARDICREILDRRGKSKEELISFINPQSTNVIHLLNFFEELAFSIENDLVDKELVREQFEEVVLNICEILKPWIVEYKQQPRRTQLWVKTSNLCSLWSQ